MSTYVYVSSDLESFQQLLETYKAAEESLLDCMEHKMVICDLSAVGTLSGDIREVRGKIEVYEHVIRTLKESLRLGVDQHRASIRSVNSNTSVPAKKKSGRSAGSKAGSKNNPVKN